MLGTVYLVSSFYFHQPFQLINSNHSIVSIYRLNEDRKGKGRQKVNHRLSGPDVAVTYAIFTFSWKT